MAIRTVVLALGAWAALAASGRGGDEAAAAPPAPAPSHQPGCNGPGCAGGDCSAPRDGCGPQPRFPCLLELWQWATYCPEPCCACGKQCTPCCNPPLYAFFLWRCAACVHRYPDHPVEHRPGYGPWPPAFVDSRGSEAIYEDDPTPRETLPR
jgi:hypothetical protein